MKTNIPKCTSQNKYVIVDAKNGYLRVEGSRNMDYKYCSYCFSVFGEVWDYVYLKEFYLCSICCEEILRNQEQDKRINKIKHKLHCGEKQFFRGGSILKNLTSRPEKYLTGEDILLIYNSYGIRVEQLKILLLSHGCDGDYDEFVRLLEEQHERSKNMRQC